jgi:hypothetical protein
VEGIIQNFGITFSEINIPVNAQFMNDTGVIFYNETVIVLDPLAPGAQTIVTFSNVTFPENPGHYWSIKLTMMTQLSNDDHPENNKKTKIWSWDWDIYPPNTTAFLSGTMGHNDWYISNVQVTLMAEDNKGWPSGVDYTMFKIDDGEWTVYETPFVVDTDGEHTVYFYSVDKCYPPNIEETRNVSFKMDTTAPVIITFTVTAQNALKTKWLLIATANDPTSGIVLVEFYADDELVGNVTSPPFEFLIEQKICNAYCNVYDEAGNFQMSDVVTSYEYGNQQQYYNPRQVL